MISSQQEAADYVHDMALELAQISRTYGMHVVATCLSMAALEAGAIALETSGAGAVLGISPDRKGMAN